MQEEAARNLTHLQRVRGEVCRQSEQTNTWFLREDRKRFWFKPGRDHHLGKDFCNRCGHLCGDRAVRSNHPTKCRNGVALVCEQVRGGDRVYGAVRCDRDAARVCVFDDRDGGKVVVGCGSKRGIGINIVVVRHLLAVQLRCLCNAGALVLGEKRTALVTIFTVSQHAFAQAEHLKADGLFNGRR